MNLADLASCYLIALSVYHVGTGAISYFAPESAMRFYRAAYGADPIERRHLLIILRPWGALALFAGIAGLGAVARPEARTWIEAGLIALLLLRAGYRVRLRHELESVSRIPPGRNWFNVALVLAGAALLGTDLALAGR